MRRRRKKALVENKMGLAIVQISTGYDVDCDDCTPASCNKFAKCLKRCWDRVANVFDPALFDAYVNLLKEEEQKLLQHIRGFNVEKHAESLLPKVKKVRTSKAVGGKKKKSGRKK